MYKQLHISSLPLSMLSLCLLAISLVYVRSSGLAPSLASSCLISHQSMLGHKDQPHLSLAIARYLISLCQAISNSFISLLSLSSLFLVSSKGIATVSHFRLVFNILQLDYMTMNCFCSALQKACYIIIDRQMNGLMDNANSRVNLLLNNLKRITSLHLVVLKSLPMQVECLSK